MTVDFDKLKAPFPPDRVSWRVGATNKDKTKGLALAFIDARDVMDRLDEVCGPAGWQCRYPHANSKTVCEIGILVDGTGEYAAANPQWIWKANGAGDTDVEAEKGALSDSFKRAAVLFGIGRYLYDVDSPWVEIEAHGKSYGIKASELLRLRKLLGNRAPASKSEPLAAPQIAPAPRVTGKLALKYPDGSAAPYDDEKAWFTDLERYAMEDASMWTLNIDTARKLAKESDEWKAWGKKIAGMLAPMAG